MRIFDSHVHFFDPSRVDGVVWPAPDSQIYKRHLPADLVEASKPVELTGCIAVETSRRQEDDEWLLRLSDEYPLIGAVVLNLQPDLEGFESRLQNAVRNKKFAGIRFRPIDDYELTSPMLGRSIGLLGDFAKTIEFGARSVGDKLLFAVLAKRFPNISWILNHSGHPEHDWPPSSDWIDGMSKIAALPNTTCKISGDCLDGSNWRALIEHLMFTFGPKRTMYGSNWPVCDLSADRAVAVRELSRFLGAASDDVLVNNARQIYRVPTVAAVDTC